jgi:hypothetical protein
MTRMTHQFDMVAGWTTKADVREAIKDKFLKLERSGELLIFMSPLSGGL